MTADNKCSCDKTTWALLLAAEADADFVALRHVVDNIHQLPPVSEELQARRKLCGVMARAQLVQLGEDVHLARDEGDEHWRIAADPVDLNVLMETTRAGMAVKQAIRKWARAELLLELIHGLLEVPGMANVRSLTEVARKTRLKLDAADERALSRHDSPADEGDTP